MNTATAEKIDIDRRALTKELNLGLVCWMEMPTSRTHLAALAASASHTIVNPEASDELKAFLRDFLIWCDRQAGFGPETRKWIWPDE